LFIESSKINFDSFIIEIVQEKKVKILNETEKEEFEVDDELDTRGLFCPEPLFETRNLSETLSPGKIFKVIADDPAADEDLHRWAKRTGTEILSFEKDNDDLIFIFKKPE